MIQLIHVAIEHLIDGMVSFTKITMKGFNIFVIRRCRNKRRFNFLVIIQFSFFDMFFLRLHIESKLILDVFFRLVTDEFLSAYFH